jgi:GTP cyclohydrolase I
MTSCQCLVRFIEIGENHIGSCATNPVRDDAFAISDDEKLKK